MSKVLDNKKYVVDSLLKTGREGMEDLVSYMEEIGFFEAPCSGGNHMACRFGLVHHTRNVMEAAEKFGVALLGGKEYNKIKDSVVIAAALHDLGKCGDFGKANYVPNKLKSGEISESKPFKVNPDLLYEDHEVRSIKLAAMFIDLTEEEEAAILYHNGLYGPFAYTIKNKNLETPLYMLIHFADMWASRVMEGGED